MSKYRLKGTSGAVINQVFPLAATLVIGRADDCDIRIEHDSVAAHHVQVLLSDSGGISVQDLGSEAGTRVNGERVKQAELSAGDEVQVGNCRLMLQAPGLRPDRVLGTDAVRVPAKRWPWLLATLLGVAVILAWQNGMLEKILAMIAG